LYVAIPKSQPLVAPQVRKVEKNYKEPLFRNAQYRIIPQSRVAIQSNAILFRGFDEKQPETPRKLHASGYTTTLSQRDQ